MPKLVFFGNETANNPVTLNVQRNERSQKEKYYFIKT